jgi:hypothetical protein
MKIKIILSVLLSFWLTACGLNVTLNTSADEIAASASEIASFDLPAGYSPEFTASLKAYTLVAYTPGDGRSHLYLVQSQDAADADKMKQALQDILPGESDPQTRLTVLETRSVTVRGQETTLVLSEGTNGDGDLYRQAMVAFEGNGGPALLIFSAPETAWNLETTEALIASLR